MSRDGPWTAVETALAGNPFDRLRRLTPAARARLVRELPVDAAEELASRWAPDAHAGQLAPPGDWHVWLIRAGRGFGKTRAGAEWISQLARDNPKARIALVGGTIEDARRVMVEGVSGLVAVSRIAEDMIWMPGKGELIFPSGARAYVYAATKPESLRGPEHDAAWCDELGKWGPGGEAAWDNLLLGLRVGERPRVVVTTTPRATVLMRRMMAMPGLVETSGSTRDNRHLPDSYVAGMEALYGRSRLGRQELDGEMIDDVAGALWTRTLLEARRAAELPPVVRVVVGVDPPAGSVTEGKRGAGRRGDACGIVAVARGRDGHAYVIEDASVTAASPAMWARAVAGCAARVGADRVVAEANQGGRMVEEVLRAACATLPLKLVHASHGKVARAEPVAALYEAGRAWHLGAFPALEDELCGLVAGGGYEGPGPLARPRRRAGMGDDRADAHTRGAGRGAGVVKSDRSGADRRRRNRRQPNINTATASSAAVHHFLSVASMIAK